MSFLVLVLAVWIEKFSALRHRLQRDGGWLRELASLPFQLVRDTLTVCAALFGPSRQTGGRMSSTPFRHGGEDPESTARRAVATGLSCLPPNSIACTFDPHTDTAIYHELQPQPQPPSALQHLGAE